MTTASGLVKRLEECCDAWVQRALETEADRDYWRRRAEEAEAKVAELERQLADRSPLEAVLEECRKDGIYWSVTTDETVFLSAYMSGSIVGLHSQSYGGLAKMMVDHIVENLPDSAFARRRRGKHADQPNSSETPNSSPAAPDPAPSPDPVEELPDDVLRARCRRILRAFRRWRYNDDDAQLINAVIDAVRSAKEARE